MLSTRRQKYDLEYVQKAGPFLALNRCVRHGESEIRANVGWWLLVVVKVGGQLRGNYC
jgi:hypothetical protein